MHQNPLNLVRLLDPYTNPHAVNGRLDKHALVFIAGDDEWV